MAGITLEKGKHLYSEQSVTSLYLITNGQVQVSYPGGSYTLRKGDVAGICEICSEIHFLEYIVLEDTVVAPYPLISMESLGEMLEQNTELARLFLLSAFHQLNSLLGQCSLSELSCSNIYQMLMEDFELYS